ncbi:MAG: hypothetical protein A2V64_11940 [Bacteroidetes bacterium RBG_13_43_22]|nr:MAG: hypothetical protein A2V64_11940 [Bacteroidetes bacterium RBG_13_43_22]
MRVNPKIKNSILIGPIDGGSPDEANETTGNNVKSNNKKIFLKAFFLQFNILLIIKIGISGFLCPPKIYKNS